MHGEWRRSGLWINVRVITKWRQPLRSSKNAKSPKETFVDIVRQDPVPRKRSKHSPTMRQCEKTCSGRPRKRRPTEMEFDHELRLWLKSKKSRKTHLDTRVEGGAAQSGRKIAHGVDVINTRRSAGTILTGCNYAGHCPK